MATGQVTITQDNNAGGGITEVERKILFVGIGGASALHDQVHTINQQSDLDVLLGIETSDLKTNIEAAKNNAGPNFTAYVIPVLASGGVYTWDTALEFALDMPNDLDFELVALTTPMTSSNDVDLYQTATIASINTFAKYITIHAAVPGISDGESWSDYLAATKALQQNKAAHRVSLVPQLHGNDLGVVVGRLCNDSYSLGDSPMRVASGPVIGLGQSAVDVNGISMTMAHVKDLADNRFSVSQIYTGLEGNYWADHMTLDAAGGDFQVYENMRVLDYVTRRVRILAIKKIADRSLNSTSSSKKYHEKYFMQPILDASKETSINGQPKPSLVQKPQDGDIVLTWKSTTEVEMYMQAAPINSPKKISAHISLDLKRLG